MKGWIHDLIWFAMKFSADVIELDGAQALDLGVVSPGPAIKSLADGLAVLRNTGLFHRRVQRACRRYVLFDEAAPEFWPLADAIVLGKSELAESNNGQVALVLVHEATHARLARLGLSARRFGVDRIEQACVRRERRAAADFPNGPQWVAFVDAKAGSRWWSSDEAALRIERQLAGAKPSRLRRWLARKASRWATRNHPGQD